MRFGLWVLRMVLKVVRLRDALSRLLDAVDFGVWCVVRSMRYPRLRFPVSEYVYLITSSIS